MTEENKRMLGYIKFQMKGGATFNSICKSFGYVKEEILTDKLKCCGNCFNFTTDKRCADKIGSEVCDRWFITL